MPSTRSSTAAASPEATAITPYPGAAKVDLERRATRKSFLSRAGWFVSLWVIKAAVRIYLWRLQWLHRKGPYAPTLVKHYPVQPGLPVRIFIPKSYTAGSAPLPLLLFVHGGGYALGGAALADADNARWANERGFVVAALSYRLAPRHPFPAAVEDVAALMKAVLDDSSLPVDHTRVVATGESAGGNLVLTAPQLHGLHERIQAAVPWYPSTDAAVAVEERMRLSSPHPDGRKDLLHRSIHAFIWGYFPPGHLLRDPLMSPRYAERSKLPEFVFVIGAQHDMLCHEGWSMAEELAEKEGKGKESKKTVSRPDGDESWECGRIRWRRVLGVEHGFNRLISHKDPAEADLYKRKARGCEADMLDWLKRVVWPARPATA